MRSTAMRVLSVIFALLWPFVIDGLAHGQAVPTYGGRVRIAQSAEPPSLDPSATTASATTAIVHHNVLEGLVKVDESGTIVPGLASSWSVSSDALKYTFHLRENVKFHDGQPFTSADVKAKFEKALQPDSGHTNAHYYEQITSIETPDPYTVVFHMKSADAEFLYNLARPDSVIFPAETTANMATHPIGTGPYRLKTWMRGSHITLERFDDYYDESLPYLDEVTFRFISDPNAQVAALLAGDVDAVDFSSTAEQALRVQQTAGFKVIEGATTNTVVMAMNNSRPALSDVRVRKALSYAINREEVMIGAEFGFGTPIGSHMSPVEPYYIDLTDVYSYDPDRARQLLNEAGYGQGLELTLSLPNQYRYAVRAGELIADQLRQVGVTVNIELVEWATWISRIFGDADYDLTVIGHAEPMDIGIYGNPNYYFRYDSAKVRQLLHDARVTADETQRAHIYAAIQLQLVQDAVNVWLYARPSFLLSRDDLHGWWASVPMVITDVTGVYYSR